MATGLYPHQHKVIGNDPVFAFDEKLRYREEWMAMRNKLNKPITDTFHQNPTIADILGEQGYISLPTGKWWEGH